MNKTLGSAALALAVGFMLAGCSNTGKGLAEDASKDTHAVGSAADNAGKDIGSAASTAGHDIGKGAKNTTSATVVTPEIKTAIIRDPILNNSHNLINVESKNGVVHLTGHVTSANMKTRAEQDAQATLQKHNRTDKVQDDLTVGAG